MSCTYVLDCNRGTNKPSYDDDYDDDDDDCECEYIIIIIIICALGHFTFWISLSGVKLSWLATCPQIFVNYYYDARRERSDADVWQFDVCKPTRLHHTFLL